MKGLEHRSEAFVRACTKVAGSARKKLAAARYCISFYWSDGNAKWFFSIAAIGWGDWDDIHLGCQTSGAKLTQSGVKACSKPQSTVAALELESIKRDALKKQASARLTKRATEQDTRRASRIL